MLFPPRPVGLKGRRAELATLARLLDPSRPARVALVGSGGSGKSMLACAAGHRVRPRFAGGIHWFRCGPWDARTLAEMLAIRFRVPFARTSVLFASLRRTLGAGAPKLVVLDNHENDAAVATLLNELRRAPVAWMLTARRCLLSGVTIYPVVAPEATTGKSAFPRVKILNRLLRQNPLALDIADAIVASGAAAATDLRDWLESRGALDVHVMDHEDDLPEVALLVDWAWPRLGRPERRMLAVLAETGGDHVDGMSLARLAGILDRTSATHALDRLRRWHVVQTPFVDRYTLHAVVRYAVAKRTRFPPERFVEHYVTLLERSPERFDLEQTHLYAAMDFAHARSSLDWMLRIERLIERLADAERRASAP